MAEPGGPEVLRVEERPVPEPRPGWVLVRVRAFGLNRSELVTRRGGSGDAVRFPRVLGIECVGEVVEAPDADLRGGHLVVGRDRALDAHRLAGLDVRQRARALPIGVRGRTVHGHRPDRAIAGRDLESGRRDVTGTPQDARYHHGDRGHRERAVVIADLAETDLIADLDQALTA